MKNLIYIAGITIISATTLLTSCQNDFLEKTPYDAIPFDDAILSEDDMQAALNGVYSNMLGSSLYGRTFPIMGDLLADNAYISTVNSGRYIPFNTYAIFDDNGDIGGLWASAYYAILNANQVIAADIPSNANVDQMRGEAYAARGAMYFDLVRVFGKPYSDAHISSPGVPIVLTYEPSLKPARNTIGEVYAQVISDLTNAINLMNEEKNSEYFSRWAAEGLLARVYQYMGDWENAKLQAQDLIDNSGYSLVDSAGYVAFWADPGPTEQSETLFELRLDIVVNNGYNSLAAMYDDAIYGDALCDSAFYNSYGDGDVRKLLLVPQDDGGEMIYRVNKYPNSTNTSDYDNAKVIRLSEVYLLLAEAYYHLGDEGNARTYLNTIAQIREPSFSGYTSSGDILLNDITNERRKELAFEGNRFFDLNRLGLDINRSLQFPADAQYIPASDHRRVMPIPQYEINANPDMVQNEGY
jgi:hypothetical protein